MVTDSSKLKFYHPVNATDPASTGYGGDVNTASLMTTASRNNEFTNVSNLDRINGLTDYRKQFFRNENTESVPEVRVWISSNTPATNDTVAICQGGSLSLLGATALLGTATYVESATILTFGSSVEFSIRPGEWVYSITNDGAMGTPKMVATVSSNKVTLQSAFGSSTAGNDVIGVCPATMFTFSSPASKAEAFYIGSIPASTSIGMWKRRVVSAGGPGYVDDYVTVRWESG